LPSSSSFRRLLGSSLGLSSRGLLHHALYRRILVEAIVQNKRKYTIGSLSGFIVVEKQMTEWSFRIAFLFTYVLHAVASLNQNVIFLNCIFIYICLTYNCFFKSKCNANEFGPILPVVAFSQLGANSIKRFECYDPNYATDGIGILQDVDDSKYNSAKTLCTCPHFLSIFPNQLNLQLVSSHTRIPIITIIFPLTMVQQQQRHGE
jgi:hypothetical protein